MFRAQLFTVSLFVLTICSASHGAADKLCRLYLELEGKLAAVPTVENPARIRLEWEIIQDPGTGHEWKIRHLESQIIRLTGPLSTSPNLPVYYPEASFNGGDVSPLGVSFGDPDDEVAEVEWMLPESGTFAFEGEPWQRAYRRDDRLAGDLVFNFDFTDNVVGWTFQSYNDPTHREVAPINAQSLRSGNLQIIEIPLTDGPGQLLSRAIAGVSRTLREAYGEDFRVVPKVREMLVQREQQREYLLRQGPLWKGHFSADRYKPLNLSNLDMPEVKNKMNDLARELLFVGPLRQSANRVSSQGMGRVWQAASGSEREFVLESFNISTGYSTSVGFIVERK